MTEVVEIKQKLRRMWIAAHKAVPAEVLAEASRRIAVRLLAGDVWQRAETVFCYVSYGWEIGTDAILQAAFAAGKRIGVPLCAADGVMTAREVRSRDELVPGMYGILEPSEDASVILPVEFDLAVVPGVAFDRAGYRMGRGGGYYDRYLESVRGVTVGLCLEQFLMDSVPCELHDRKMDTILTEKGEYTWA